MLCLEEFRPSAKRPGLFGILIVAALVSATVFTAFPVMRWMSEDEARDATARLAAHLFDEIEDVAGASADPRSSVGYRRLAGAIEAALRLGAANGVTIREAHCDCALPIRAASLSDPDSNLAEQLRDFFTDRPSAGADRASALPPGEPRDRIGFTEGTAPGEPRYGADVAFARTIGAERYELTLFTDVTATTVRLRLLATMAGMILTLALAGALLLIYHISDRSRRAVHLSERQARYLAERDPLTGLFNRIGFALRARALLRASGANGGRAVFFQIDADRLKNINDVFGHAAGDRVIKAVAELLTGAFPSGAIIARLGGDEFAVLVEEAALGDAADAFLATLPTATAVMSDDGEALIDLSTSVGFAVCPDDATDLSGLMKAADLALYAVKNGGRNGVAAYCRDMSKSLERRHWELEGIREAIRRGQLLPHYQPLLDARTGRVRAVEALARWHHPTYGVLRPDRFGHALRDAALAGEITRAILTHIAADLRVWRNLGHDFSAGLNIGEADLRNPGFLDMVGDALAAQDLAIRDLAIEVTEDAIRGVDTALAEDVLSRYRAGGGFVALDDFGTGGSSINLLKTIPYSTVKIDRSFVRDLTTNQTDLAIVRSIVGLSRDLSFKIVAEGIESKEQAQILRRMRVDLLQGYLYSRPLPAREMTEFLEWASPPAAGRDVA